MKLHTFFILFIDDAKEKTVDPISLTGADL